MRGLVIVVLIYITIFDCFSQNRTDLNTDLLSQELKANANAVVRNSEDYVEVKELDNVVFRKKISITILNSNGKSNSYCYVNYDPSRQLKYIKGNLYNAQGSLIYKIPESKFSDVSQISDFSLFEDDRLKYFAPSYSDYPYTVEYEYELKLKNTFYLPGWTPQFDEDLSIEKSSFSLVHKTSFQVRIKEYNFSGEKEEQSQSNMQTHLWQVRNLKAFKSEQYSPDIEEWNTKVLVAPVDFMYEKLVGRFSNWEEYGKWTYEKLLKGRDNLPDATVAKINDLVKDLPSDKEKIKKIYEYVQGKTRYVSIQKGIGGLQPMKAEDVDRLGYGDCKALSYYTQSLLKIVGIKSHYAEVYGNSRIQNITPGFAAVQGNHVILCVPVEKDTIWLECTSQTHPFGYLGAFTDNRHVVLCTEKGGVIAKTKKYETDENTIVTEAELKIDQEGNLEGKLTSNFSGIFLTSRNELIESSGKKRSDLLHENYPINNLEVKKFNILQEKTNNPLTTETLEFNARNYGSKSNTRLFIYLNKISPYKNHLESTETRVNPIWISRGYIFEDKLNYILPENYDIEFLPKSEDIKNDFGSLNATVQLQGNKLTYVRKLHIKEGRYKADQYKELVTFLQKAEKADFQKIILSAKVN
jgi:hypothetical protein